MIEQILQADRLLQVDQVEQAQQLYQHVVELDPGNAIATVGLAQCALATGDDRGAHELAARALQIDPENDMARRMEARLAEILATRGELVDRPVSVATPSSRAMRAIVTEPTPVTTEVVASGHATEPSPTLTTGVPVTTSEARQPSVTEAVPPLVSNARKSLLDRLMGR